MLSLSLSSGMVILYFVPARLANMGIGEGLRYKIV